MAKKESAAQAPAKKKKAVEEARPLPRLPASA